MIDHPFWSKHLRLVFKHIIRNAIDALESQEEKKREAIPEESLKHIFDPFFSSRDVGEGIGLGMSLSYMIIKKHGGNMEVKNEMGRVSFDVLMPAWVEENSAGNRAAF